MVSPGLTMISPVNSVYCSARSERKVKTRRDYPGTTVIVINHILTKTAMKIEMTW